MINTVIQTNIYCTPTDQRINQEKMTCLLLSRLLAIEGYKQINCESALIREKHYEGMLRLARNWFRGEGLSRKVSRRT